MRHCANSNRVIYDIRHKNTTGWVTATIPVPPVTSPPLLVSTSVGTVTFTVTTTEGKWPEVERGVGRAPVSSTLVGYLHNPNVHPDLSRCQAAIAGFDYRGHISYHALNASWYGHPIKEEDQLQKVPGGSCNVEVQPASVTFFKPWKGLDSHEFQRRLFTHATEMLGGGRRFHTLDETLADIRSIDEFAD
ncbi:hypothetical protein PG985_013122 [Apiospora marii]|uniref:uncharacterized protein n=1 Tax=Apiospora marii TaxID=335849 RepID=UPI00312F9012